MKRYWGVEAQRHSFLTSALVEAIYQLHAPANLLPGKKPRYHFDMTLSGPQNRSGHSGEEKKILSMALPGIEPGSSST
jgi:hypothetical protein